MVSLAVFATAPVFATEFSGRVTFLDADTVNVGDKRVRLFGIDAPEASQTCTKDNGKVWKCGEWATQQAKRFFGRKTATCEAVEIDRYGRIVATCWVAGQDIAEKLVLEGAALAYRRYSTRYIDAEKRAAIQDIGLWSGTVITPADYRAAMRNSAPAANVNANCVIKGNISKNGKIYHMPGQKFYNNVRISASRGEQWFCTQTQARNAGWRKARQ